MSRKKKVKAAFKNKVKKAKARLHKSNKPKYVSKAEREKLTLSEQPSDDENTES